MKKISQKSLAVLAIILSFLFFDFAFAETKTFEKVAQSKASSSVTKKVETTEDPDLKLSIDELKQKYPISLLDKKKKNYKLGQKINIDDYSNAEIKAAFLNADRNFKQKNVMKKVVKRKDKELVILDEEVVVHDPQELAIIEASCDKFGNDEYPSKLSKNQKVLQSFIFSNRMIREYINSFIPDKIGLACFESDPLGTEDRN